MKDKKVDFESAVKRLDEIVRALESGDAKLEDSLLLFEEGVKLTAECNKLLDKAEQKVLMFVRGEQGEMTAAPFSGDGV